MRIFTFSLMAIGLVFGLGLVGLGLAGCSPNNPPSTQSENLDNWALNNAQSSLEFISVKKGIVVETHSFGDLSGAVTADGDAVITVKLDSVQTNIDIRNERMKKHLFETDTYPNAELTTKLDMQIFTTMGIGERKNYDALIVAHMHGKTQSIEAELIVTRLGANKILVDSRTPILLDVDSFGLQAGVEKLRQLAKLPAITPVVPISFSLVFER